MQTQIKDFFQGLEMGTGSGHRNLVVFPLMYEAKTGLEYLSLDEALAQRVFEVEEVSPGGEVPFLRVTNRGKLPVLILAGEELVGAKQNRILNLTVLVPGQTKLIIAVSCVEQGRWRSMSTHFASGHYAPARLRNNKERSVRENLRATGAPVSDQGQVWNDVSQTLSFLHADSPTMAMADAYAKMESDLRSAAAAIQLPPGTCGMAAFVADELVVVDLFGYQATFREMSRKLIDSYLIAALSEVRAAVGRTAKAKGLDCRLRAAEMLERAAASHMEHRQTIGLGTDIRLSGNEVRGAVLAVEGLVLHASLFPDDGQADGELPRATRMASPRRRRRREP
uniref:ARG and Rhodanese-Phosphatase-superfamily-associated domain-containing protein n=1 Tax=Desulfobacca acetoxidans TaxID=60893 RepID=A0A7V4LCH6_9BACT